VFRYKVVLDSDAEQYNGHKRIDPSVQYVTCGEQWDNRLNSMHVCIYAYALYTVCRVVTAELHYIPTDEPLICYAIVSLTLALFMALY